MLLSKKLLIGGLGAVILGVSAMAPTVYYDRPEQPVQNITPAKSITVAPETIVGKPVRVQVPSLGINLDVATGSYDRKSQTWTLSKSKAYYADLSVPVNTAQGNTLVYGHAIPTIFGLLKGLKAQDKAVITTDNGYIFTYKFSSTHAVTPTNTDVFTGEGAPRLTLQTCSGSWSQNRQMYSFDLVSAIKA